MLKNRKVKKQERPSLDEDLWV